MPSNRNDEAGAAAGILGAGFLAVLAFLFGLVVLIAVAVSLIYLFALVSEKEITLWGDTYRPGDALIAYRNGIIGVAIILTVTAFICAFYGLAFPKDWLLYLIAGGYSVGSLWLWMSHDDGDDTSPTPIDYRGLQLPSSKPAEKPFEYANWDDERGKP
jgi:amino acid transporter